MNHVATKDSVSLDGRTESVKTFWMLEEKAGVQVRARLFAHLHLFRVINCNLWSFGLPVLTSLCTSWLSWKFSRHATWKITQSILSKVLRALNSLLTQFASFQHSHCYIESPPIFFCPFFFQFSYYITMFQGLRCIWRKGIFAFQNRTQSLNIFYIHVILFVRPHVNDNNWWI